MKRLAISLEQIADINNLYVALHKAIKAKRDRADVQHFLANTDKHINQLAHDITQQQLPYNRFRAFHIRDPKPRLIHAACFEDRVFHHALMNIAGNTLENAMMPHSYACRPHKGIHKAVDQVQHNLRRYPNYVKIDISGYFASISHSILMPLLMTRFKGQAIQAQFERIVLGSPITTIQGQGLPIGSLTSQYFANYFLDGLDRYLAQSTQVKAWVRYMDDIIWWCDNKAQAKQTLSDVKNWLLINRELMIKPSVQIQSSQQGVSYCGFRISQAALRLSRRRKRRYQQRRQYWEQCYLNGQITALQLQQAYASVEAITYGTDSRNWRAENLKRYPPLDI